MIIELLSSLATILGLLYFFWTRHYSYWEKKGIPCYPAEFPWGSLKQLRPFEQNIGEFLQTIYEYHENEPLIGFYGPTEPFLLVKDLNMIKSILVSDFKSFYSNGFLTYGSVDPMLRYNAFGTQELNEWKEIRGIHSPLLALNKVKSNAYHMTDSSKSMIDFISRNHGKPIEIKDLSWNFAKDCVLKINFAIDADSFNPNEVNKFPIDSTQVLFGSARTSNSAVFSAVFLPWLALILRCPVLSQDAGKFLLKFCSSAIEERRASKLYRNDIIQRLIEKVEKPNNELKMTAEMLAAQCMGVILDGFESSSTGLSHVLYDIACHSEVQEKLRREILSVGTNIEDFDGEKAWSLKYLDNCINESLRLRPPIVVITRFCTQEITLGNVNIPKGMKVFIPVRAIHTDPIYFEDPLTYNPDRFVDGGCSLKTLMHFGDGPRTCVGMRHSLMCIRIAVIAILLNFKMTSLNKFENEKSLFLLSAKELNVKFEPIFK